MFPDNLRNQAQYQCAEGVMGRGCRKDLKQARRFGQILNEVADRLLMEVIYTMGVERDGDVGRRGTNLTGNLREAEASIAVRRSQRPKSSGGSARRSLTGAPLPPGCSSIQGRSTSTPCAGLSGIVDPEFVWSRRRSTWAILCGMPIVESPHRRECNLFAHGPPTARLATCFLAPSTVAVT